MRPEEDLAVVDGCEDVDHSRSNDAYGLELRREDTMLAIGGMGFSCNGCRDFGS